SLRARGRESSRKTYYGFHLVRDGRTLPKKRAAVSGGFEVDNREASNRVDRSHSVSKRGRYSYRGESLIDRKRTILFNLRLPCRPLAEPRMQVSFRHARDEARPWRKSGCATREVK